MTGINKIIFLKKSPFRCFNCFKLIFQFKKGSLNVYNHKTKLWNKLIVSECPHCNDLFGIKNLVRN